MHTPGNRRSVVLSTVLDEGCHVFCLLSTGFLHRSSALSQEEVAQSGMEMFYLPNSTKVDRLSSSGGWCLFSGSYPGQHLGCSVSILQELRGILPRGACLTWSAGYAYGYNGSYRRGLPQPIDRPSAFVQHDGGGLSVW